MKLTYSIKIKPMTYRALNLNPIFRLIHSFKGDKDDSNKKRTSKNTSPSCVVKFSIKISNISFTLKYFELINHLIKHCSNNGSSKNSRDRVLIG